MKPRTGQSERSGGIDKIVRREKRIMSGEMCIGGTGYDRGSEPLGAVAGEVAARRIPGRGPDRGRKARVARVPQPGSARVGTTPPQRRPRVLGGRSEVAAVAPRDRQADAGTDRPI